MAYLRIAPLALAAPLAGALTVACGNTSDPDMVFSTVGETGAGQDDGADTNPADDGSGDGTSPDEGDEGGESDSGEGSIFDVNGSPDIELESGCQKVDILFVIDSSGSMGPHQQNLINSYDGFVEGISAHFGNDRDFHIGVISSEVYDWNEPGCIEQGALVTQVIDENYQNVIECAPYEEGNRFMTEADDLEQAFPCTANVGAGGDFVEQPVTSAIQAISPDMNGQGGCNEGFLRDDALLVLVMITNSMSGDDPSADAHPSQDPTPWYPAIVDAKGGNPENAVAIGFISAGDTWCIPNGWDGYQAPNLIEFIEDFGQNGVIANVCLQDYGPTFIESIDVVLDACDGFVQPG